MTRRDLFSGNSYKGYPAQPQPDTPFSPWGSRSAAAVMQPSASVARELGPVIQPASSARHWAHGWIGGLQLFAAKDGWYGLVNASPTPPASIIEEPDFREPAPSLVPIRKVWSMGIRNPPQACGMENLAYSQRFSDGN